MHPRLLSSAIYSKIWTLYGDSQGSAKAFFNSKVNSKSLYWTKELKCKNKSIDIFFFTQNRRPLPRWHMSPTNTVHLHPSDTESCQTLYRFEHKLFGHHSLLLTSGVAQSCIKSITHPFKLHRLTLVVVWFILNFKHDPVSFVEFLFC